MVRPAAWLFPLLAGCSTPATRSTDAGFDFAAFAASVDAQSTSCSSQNCGAAFTAVAVASPSEAHARVLAVVANLYGATTGAVTANSVVDCTSPTGNCATRFNHDLYKGDGCRGDALLPSAKIVLAEAAGVEYVIWSATINGLTTPAAITLAGIRDGRLLGLLFFFDRATCADTLR